jgi:hypothetical protein
MSKDPEFRLGWKNAEDFANDKLTLIIPGATKEETDRLLSIINSVE